MQRARSPASTRVQAKLLEAYPCFGDENLTVSGDGHIGRPRAKLRQAQLKIADDFSDRCPFKPGADVIVRMCGAVYKS